MPLQKIYYGAPGTGKSFKITEMLKGVDEEFIFRTIIHPEYTYSDFVGQLLPDIDENGNIIFVFKKGVFTDALVKAYEDTRKDIFLVIEEISRGNVAGIFGDIFQLLDRDSYGVSEYPVVNKQISKEIKVLAGDKITLPSNFNIICTVNMNDQNVYPMDTAFKRRFEWEYVSPNPVCNLNGDVIKNLNNFKMSILYQENGQTNELETNWLTFYIVLNDYITNKNYGMKKNEDKQVGQFFLKIPSEIVRNSHSSNSESANKAKKVINKMIKNKLLLYLWQDVQGNSDFVRGNKLFLDTVVSFQYLYENYELTQIFSDEFISKLKSRPIIYAYMEE